MFGEFKKKVDGAFERCDKATMFQSLQQLNGLTAVAGKAALSLRSRLLDVNISLVVVLIILVLLTQNGEGLTA